ncbi:ankyrin [Parathielavia hyrcaniae]|uniref:Ankyrin n=1 Tax=Parathielavia hyrcaniae TaxID=113614 RepID=A0AAN6PYF9_9PEZI|nr:ankyrin [Parathielavia hyrcaniae]
MGIQPTRRPLEIYGSACQVLRSSFQKYKYLHIQLRHKIIVATEGTALDWDTHGEEILDLYVTQKQSLPKVMEHMRTKRGVHATERQYKYRLPRLKNRRAALGKQPVVFLGNEPLQTGHVSRGISRIRKKEPEAQVTKRAPRWLIIGRISLRSPPPAIVGFEGAAPSSPDIRSEIRAELSVALARSSPPVGHTGTSLGFPSFMCAPDDHEPVQVVAQVFEGVGVSSADQLKDPLPGLKRSSPVTDGLVMGSVTEHPSPAIMSSGFKIMVQSALCRSMTEPEFALSASEVTPLLQHLVPERYEGDLSKQIERMSDPSLLAAATLPSLFALAAFFASNNSLDNDDMDTFLRWIIEHSHQTALMRFMEFQSPSVHAFAKALLESAIRIKSVPMLHTLLNCGVKLDRMLFDITSIGDTPLTRRVLSHVSWYGAHGKLLYHFVVKRQFDLAQFLLDNWVSANAHVEHGSALYTAVGAKDIETIKFLLNAGADFNMVTYHADHRSSNRPSASPFGYAVYLGNAEAVELLLDHGANISSSINCQPIMEWAALRSRPMCQPLKERLEPGTEGYSLGNLVDAANHGVRALAAYIAEHLRTVTAHQLERALAGSIRHDHLTAAITLLQHGVNPNGPTLKKRPRNSSGSNTRAACIDMEQGIKALASAAACGYLVSAAALIRAGVDINTPGPRLKPLQAAAAAGDDDDSMVLFLIHKGAHINAPANPNGGRTALQAALEGEGFREIGEILLRHGAVASAAPALLNGVTALEAFCHNDCLGRSDEDFRYVLLDAGATVNRPDGKPSSAIHGVIENRWHKVLHRFLEPHHGAIINYMWSQIHAEVYDDDGEEPLSFLGDLEALRMLLEHKADVNEAPGSRFGRTALQAAASLQPGPTKTTIIHMLLERGADVHADPAPEGGITALQGAAIAGNLKLAQLLIDRKADVNVWPALIEGRTAIEGAAEHGRLDMVKLLLNAGAKGDVALGTGFNRAFELAKEQGHFAVASLLETEQPGLSRR